MTRRYRAHPGGIEALGREGWAQVNEVFVRSRKKSGAEMDRGLLVA